jgi:hypothetical protein
MAPRDGHCSIEAAPVVLKEPGSVGSRHGCFGNVRRGRSHRGELHRASNCTQVPIGVEGAGLDTFALRNPHGAQQIRIY